MFLCCIVGVAAVLARLTATTRGPFSLSGNMEGVDLNVELEENAVDFSSRGCLS